MDVGFEPEFAASFETLLLLSAFTNSFSQNSSIMSHLTAEIVRTLELDAPDALAVVRRSTARQDL